MEEKIFHILSIPEWDEAVQRGEYDPRSLEAKGYIHCSSVQQVCRVADFNFLDQKELLLLEIAPERVISEVKWENTEGGQEEFPHIYGPLNLSAIQRVYDFNAKEGHFNLPECMVDSPELSSEILVLFDIDGTLVTSEYRTPKIAFMKAIEEVFGVDVSAENIVMHGNTDPLILQEMAGRGDISTTRVNRNLKKLESAVIRHFYNVSRREKFQALKGVRELLIQLEEMGIPCALVTGNFASIGWWKLHAAKLDQYFVCGAFGSDHAQRSQLAKMAVEIAEQKLGFKRDTGKIVMIGDAIADMEAAKGIGAKAIGVTTGAFTRQQLKDANADIVLKDLENTEKLLKLIKKA
jgi:uncharacterized protein (DUF952 family)/phosphoglycolate phosphatase-like HAD superfamily hydrolase